MTANWFLRALLTIFLVSTSLFSVRPMVSYRALEFGASNAEIGVLAASFGVLAFIVAIPTGQWIDRLGETRFILAGTVVMAATCFWLVVATGIVSLGVAQAFLGAGQIFTLVALQTLVANCGPPAERDGRFGIFAVTASMGQVAGPSLGGFVASVASGTEQVFLVSGFLMFVGIAAALSLFRWPPPQNARTDAGGVRREATLSALGKVSRIKSMPQAMTASVCVLVTIDLIVAYLPVYGEANAIPVATVGLLLSVRAGASALSRLVMVWLIRVLGRRRTFVMSLVLPAVALALVPFFPNPGALFVLMALAGFGLGLGQPMSLSWVAGAAPVEFRGIALGVRLTGNRLGQVVLPALVGVIGGATTVGVVFGVLGGMLGTSAGVVLTARFEEEPSH